MLLAINAGNTNISLGMFSRDGLSPEKSWRISASRERTFDEYGIMFLGLLSSAGFSSKDIEDVVACSVVPELDGAITEASSAYLKKKPLFAGRDIPLKIPVVRGNPEEVGVDRIVNAVAAYGIYRSSLIVVDMGTAITFDYVSEKGEYVGGPIAPGISISVEALRERTSRLPLVDLKKPLEVIGRNTSENIRAGVFYGFAGLVDGVVESMSASLGTRPRVVATGGAASFIAGQSKCIEEVDEHLTLKGLKTVYEGR